MKYKLLLILLFFINFPNFVCADDFYCFEQKSTVSGKSKLFINPDWLIIDIDSSKIRVIARANQNNVTVINLKDKIYCECPSTSYHGNLAQSLAASALKTFRQSPWIVSGSLIHDNINCIKLVKLSSNNINTKKSQDNSLNLISEDKVKYKSLTCFVYDSYKLSYNQKFVIGTVFGLKDLPSIPIESYMILQNNKLENRLLTTKKYHLSMNIPNLLEVNAF